MGRIKLFIPLFIFAVLAILFWRGLSLDPTYVPSALLNKPLPPFQLLTVKDEKRMVNEQELKGRASLVNIWATWCYACQIEHPFLLTLAEQGVPIYGVNYNDDSAQARQWLEKYHDPYVLSVADTQGRLGLDLGVTGAPETYVLDSEGVIVFKHVGIVNEQVWTQTIEPIMAKLGSRQ